MSVKRDGGKSRQIMRAQCLGRKSYEKIQLERCKQRMRFERPEIVVINDKYILMIYIKSYFHSHIILDNKKLNHSISFPPTIEKLKFNSQDN